MFYTTGLGHDFSSHFEKFFGWIYMYKIPESKPSEISHLCKVGMTTQDIPERRISSSKNKNREDYKVVR